MAKNKVLVEFQIVQKGKTISVVQKETEKLRKTQDRTAQSTKNLTKQQDMGYGRQKQGVVQTANSTKNFSKLANTIDGGSGSLVGAYATLAANVFAASAAFNALAGAARFEQLKDGLDILGTNSGRTLSILASDLKAVTGNALSLEQAFSGAALGISGGFGGEELKGLARIARGASLALGRDLADAFDRLTRGAIKLEPEILDELGIMVRLDDAVDQYATQLGKTAGALSQAERRQAFMNAILVQGSEKFGEIADSVEPTVFDQLAATFGDLTKNVFSFINAGLSPVIKLLANNTLLLSAAMIGFGSTLTKQIVPGLADAGAAARRQAERMAQIAEASEEAGKAVRAAFVGNLESLNKSNKSAKNFTQSIVDGDTSLGNLQKTQGRVNKSLGQLTTKRAQEAGLNTVLIKQRRKEQEILAELILMEKAKAAISIKTKQTEVAATAAANAANQITLFTAGGQNFSQSMAGISAASNILKTDLMDIAAEAAGGADKIGFMAKQSINAQVGLFKFAKGARLAGAALLGMLPIIAAVVAAIGFAVLIFNKLFNTKEQKAYIEGNKELGTILDSLKEKAEAFEKTLSSTLPTASIQIRQFEIVSNSISEINEKLKSQIKLRKEANKSRVSDNIEGLSRNDALDAVATLTEGRRKTFKASGVDAKFQSTIPDFIDPGEGKLENLLGDPDLFTQNTVRALEKKLSEADFKKVQSSIANIFQIEDSPELKSFRALMRSDIPGQARFIANEFELNILPKIKQGAEITNNDFALAIENAEKKTKLLDDNFRGLNKTIKEAEKESSKFIQGIAPKTKVDAIALQFQSIEREAQAARESAEDAGLVGTTEIGRALTDIGPNVSRLMGQAFFNDLQEFKRIEKTTNEEIRRIKEDGNLTEEQKTVKIARQKDLQEEQLEVLGEHESTVKSTFKTILEMQKAEITRQATLKNISLLQKNIAQFNQAGETASNIGLDLQKQQFRIERERLQDQRKLLENTFTGLKTAEGELSLEKFKTMELDEQLKIAKDNSIELRNVFALRNQQNLEENNALQERLALADEEASKTIIKEQALQKQLNITKQINALEQKNLETQARLDKFARTGDGTLNAKETFDLQVEAARTAVTNAEEESRIKKAIIDAQHDLQVAQLKILEEEAKVKGVDIDVAGIEKALIDARDSSKDLVDEQFEQTKNNLAITIMEGFKKGAELSAAGNVFDGYRLALAAAMADEGTGGSVITLMESFALAENVVGSFTEQLKELGPEGEAIIAMSSGLLQVGQSIAILADKNATAGEKLGATVDMFKAIGAAQQAQAKAQVAAIDQSIEAEKRRDGKSKESLAKIKQMEAKKEAIQRKAFEQNKKIQLAQAVVNGMSAIQSGFATQPFFPLGLAMGTLAIAMTAAQIKAIQAQKFQGGAQETTASTAALTIGSRGNNVDVARGATSGELNFLRGGRTTGQNLGGAGGAMGRTGYAMGFRKGYADGGIVVGERGPEVITPSAPVDITPNFALGKGETNVTFSINAIDASGVEDVLRNQQGNIIRMIREAANENGERFLETVDTQTYGSNT